MNSWRGRLFGGRPNQLMSSSILREMSKAEQVNKSDVDETKVYPIQVVTDKEKIKEYHLRRLHELSLKSIGADNKK